MERRKTFFKERGVISVLWNFCIFLLSLIYFVLIRGGGGGLLIMTITSRNIDVA